MKIHQHLFFTFVLIFFLGLAQNAIAQSIKYNDQDEIKAITGLLENKTGCERPETFTGKILKIKTYEEAKVLSYELFLLLTSGKKQNFYLIIQRQAISNVGNTASAVKAVKDFLQKDKKLRIKARACGNAGLMTPEEIIRLN